MVRVSPDDSLVAVGSTIGRVYIIENRTGKLIRGLDLTPFNLTTPERFVEGLKVTAEVPVKSSLLLPPPPPESSYLDSLPKECVNFGENLLPRTEVGRKLKQSDVTERERAKSRFLCVLDKPVGFLFGVEPETTYIVEFLCASARPQQLTPQTVLEVTVRGDRQSKNLPLVARFPIARYLKRMRMAFRTENERSVNLSFRAIEPAEIGKGRRRRLTYEQPKLSSMPVLIGETVVSAIRFRSRNILRQRGPELEEEDGAENLVADIVCEITPWRGGVSYERWQPWRCPKTPFRITDGTIANQETK